MTDTPPWSFDAARQFAWASASADPALAGRSLVVVVPDKTRSGGRYVGASIRGLYQALATRFDSITVLIALGTHGEMSESAMVDYFGFGAETAARELPKLRFENHPWKDPEQLEQIGTLTRDDMLRLSRGRLDLADVRMPLGVPVHINRRIPSADAVVIVGPILPHEVVGISGGNKYFFPGVSGPRVTQVTHWLGAVETIPRVIGVARTTVRDTIDHLAGLIAKPVKRCLALVVRGEAMYDVEWGTPEEAHARAARAALRFNTRVVGRRYRRVVAICSPKYPEIWTAGKCSYKLQGVVEDGGELVIFAPHLDAVSSTWGREIAAVGYHCLPYIQAHMSRYLDQQIPLGVLAHVTHVTGVGEYEAGVETPRIRVVLASQLDADACRAINLGYADYRRMDVEAARGDPDALVVDDAGEVLFRVDP